MPYLGNIPATQFASLDYQDLTGVTGSPVKRGFTLDNTVGSANDIEVFVNNVRQEPGVAYTVSGTTLTMTGDVETTDDFYVVFQGKAVGTASHPAGNALEATSGTFTGNVDINGNELILDADADSKIESSTDDTINIISGGTTIATATSGGLETPKNCTATVTYPASGSLVLSGIPDWANKITLVTNDLSPDTVNGFVRIRVTVGGSAVTTAVYKYVEARWQDNTTADIENNGSGINYIETTGFNAANNLFNYMLNFYKVDDYIYKFDGTKYNQQYPEYYTAFTGSIETTAAIDGFDIITATGNFDNGSARAFWS